MRPWKGHKKQGFRKSLRWPLLHTHMWMEAYIVKSPLPMFIFPSGSGYSLQYMQPQQSELLIKGVQPAARISRVHGADKESYTSAKSSLFFVHLSPRDHKHNGYELARPRNHHKNKQRHFWHSLLPLALGCTHKWPLLRGPGCANCPHQAIVLFDCAREGISSPGCGSRLCTELSWILKTKSAWDFHNQNNRMAIFGAHKYNW